MMGTAALLKAKSALLILFAIGLTIKMLLLLAMLTGAVAVGRKR